ncbi:inner membrane complex sub-compartment protein 3, putative (ISP3) [Plasmodium ovale wallikeri]|uniref:Inner membrane complex sub-compartment protein 3, putative n=4 Tax=Plasmodium ovale TaxID=36330 RepID=A0A1C3KVV0_PLAOA|nr:inner membrane complex sub-compartment protein 3, putative (ISP3) [Plasmodium ovale wallikeri]SBT44825.1 inner membrane complex sub-compartment protein 3, putative (ISP3) [Plasmodium ovale wallikeri]SBT78328.1 inner membrane complex sub-compartment protein 3, putative [Plasmodium ovale]
MGNSMCCINNDLKNSKSSIDIYKHDPSEIYGDYGDWTLEKWIDKYKNGNTIKVAFPDGNEIQCHFKIFLKEKCFELSLDNKVRIIKFNDINCILHRNSCESLLESEQNLLKSPKVIGIRLISTLKAIAFAMDSPAEARMFYEFIEKYCLNDL